MGLSVLVWLVGKGADSAGGSARRTKGLPIRVWIFGRTPGSAGGIVLRVTRLSTVGLLARWATGLVGSILRAAARRSIGGLSIGGLPVRRRRDSVGGILRPPAGLGLSEPLMRRAAVTGSPTL
jgi:hypothetical protein